MKKQARKDKPRFSLKGFERFIAKYLRKKLINMYEGKEPYIHIAGMDIFRKKSRKDPRYIPAMFLLLCAHATDAYLLTDQKKKKQMLWSLWYYLHLDLHRYRAVMPSDIYEYTNILTKAILPYLMVEYKKSLLKTNNFK